MNLGNRKPPSYAHVKSKLIWKKYPQKGEGCGNHEDIFAFVTRIWLVDRKDGPRMIGFENLCLECWEQYDLR